MGCPKFLGWFQERGKTWGKPSLRSMRWLQSPNLTNISSFRRGSELVCHIPHHKILDDLGKSRFTFEPCRTVTGLQPSRMVNSLPFRSSNLWAQKLTTAQEVIRKDPWRTRNERDLEHSAILGHLLLSQGLAPQNFLPYGYLQYSQWQPQHMSRILSQDAGSSHALNLKN